MNLYHTAYGFYLFVFFFSSLAKADSKSHYASQLTAIFVRFDEQVITKEKKEIAKKKKLDKPRYNLTHNFLFFSSSSVAFFTMSVSHSIRC